jgi:integrase
MSKQAIEQLSDNQIKQFIKSKPALDTKICDGKYLYLRMRQNNTPYFMFRIRLKTFDGIKNSWVSIGAYPEISLAQARDKARGMRSLVARGINPVDYKSDVAKLGKTFGEIVAIYCDEYFPTLKQSSTRQWQVVMRRAAVLNNVPIEKITELDINELLRIADKAKAKSIAAGLLQRIKAIFKFAKKNGYIQNNPLSDMERGYKVKPRERYLQPQEISQFFNTLFNDHQVLAITKAAIYSLAILLTRKEELLRIKWQDVDLSTGRILIRETKSFANFTIIAPQQIILLWTRLRKLYPNSEYVFSYFKKYYQGKLLNRDLNWIIDKYGTEKFTPHDFRRTGMTLLAEQGQRHDVIDAALGHVIPGVKKHYLKSNLLEERRKLLQNWADYIDSLLKIENKPVGNNWLWFDLAKI